MPTIAEIQAEQRKNQDAMGNWMSAPTNAIQLNTVPDAVAPPPPSPMVGGSSGGAVAPSWSGDGGSLGALQQQSTAQDTPLAMTPTPEQMDADPQRQTLGNRTPPSLAALFMKAAY